MCTQIQTPTHCGNVFYNSGPEWECCLYIPGQSRVCFFSLFNFRESSQKAHKNYKKNTGKIQENCRKIAGKIEENDKKNTREAKNCRKNTGEAKNEKKNKKVGKNSAKKSGGNFGGFFEWMKLKSLGRFGCHLEKICG